MTDRVPRLPLEEIRTLLEEFGTNAVEEALRVVRNENNSESVHCNPTENSSDASTNSHDFDRQRIEEAMLNASFDANFAVNHRGIIRHANHAALRQFGYDSIDELVGQNIKIIVGGGHADHHDRYLSDYRAHREKRLIGSFREVSGRRKDGSEFPCVIYIEVIESSTQDDRLLYYASIRDLTEQKEAERLQKQAQRDENIRSAIVEASFDSMFAIALDGTIKMVNRAAVESFGYNDREELLGNNIKMIVGGGHAANHDDYLRNYRETGKTSIIGSMREVTAVKKNGDEIPVILGIERIEAEGTDEPLLVAFVRDITEQKKAINMEIEVRAAEELLLNMLPEEIADRLKSDPQHLADHHDNTCILFADLVNFTSMSSRMSPVDVVKMLNELFTRFDLLVERYGLNKVKTVGDCYMVTSIPSYHNPDKSSEAMCHFALDMIEELKSFNIDHPATRLDLRVGINTGPVVAGVVGTSRFLYDLWGDAVNLASRMESTGLPSRVQVTKAVIESVAQDAFVFESRGEVEVKGKGLVETFFLERRFLGEAERFWVKGIDSNRNNIVRMGKRKQQRRSTRGLQDSLALLQDKLAAFDGSFSTIE